MLSILFRKSCQKGPCTSKHFYRTFSATLSEEHVSIQQMCRKFAESELQPIAGQLDKENKFPQRQIEKMGTLGLLSINVPTKWGGAGYDKLAFSLAVEEIARGCGGTGAIISIHNALYANLINRCGTEKQKQEFLVPFTKGTLGCFALSESEAGSNVANISTTAVSQGDYYILNGTKTWVTSALQAQAAVVFATVGRDLKHKGITAFIIPLPTHGLTVGKPEDKLGIRASSTCNLILQDVQIHRDNILGGVGEGFKIAMEQLDEARVGIASQALGIAQAALDAAMNYAALRKSGGNPINHFQAVKLRIANMALCLESARLLVWRAAVLCDQSKRSTKESCMAKLAASEAATYVSHNALQILGGMGYVSDMPVERHYRDARITEIYGGVSDIQRLIIGESIIKEYK